MKITKVSLGSNRSIKLEPYVIIKPTFQIEVEITEEDGILTDIRKNLETLVHEQLDALEHNEKVRYKKARTK